MPTPKTDSEDTEILLDDLAYLANQIGGLLGQKEPDRAALDQVQATVKSLAISFGVYKDAYNAEDARLKRDGLKRLLVPIEFIGAWQILH
jgi:formyltetrahydrofolate synthetase